MKVDFPAKAADLWDDTQKFLEAEFAAPPEEKKNRVSRAKTQRVQRNAKT